MTRRGRITVQTAAPAQADRLHALITAHQSEGHLLPRTLEDVQRYAGRFVVAVAGPAIVGCAELAPLSPHVAEIRSLVVAGAGRARGVGTAIVDELRRRARLAGYDKLCAFTHTPGYFSRLGFSIVPHQSVAEKVMTDCVSCPLFRRCGQYAMMMPLESMPEATHDAALHPAHPV